MDKKGKQLLDFMKSFADKSKCVFEILTKLKFVRGSLELGCTGELKDMVLLLLLYFNEKDDDLFCSVEETSFPRALHLQT